MTRRVGVAFAIFVATMLCSGSNGQAHAGAGWLSGLSESIGALNRNIQQSVQQLNQQVQQTVQANLAQVHQMTNDLNERIATEGNVVQTKGSNIFVSGNGETKIVQSGRTSDGKPYVRESIDKIVGDTLRHTERIYDPTTKETKVHAYTLDLKDPNAKPVPINDAA
ncbi:uncharacterized protein LOC108630576 [Ceratina calcarata]|uniref:Uncharacterized protein LOC108630576 n=1 Tax=Ceratina calcarata TaxID=156304 RepID=A0AAJ7JBF6_9HYME|nr:uncharacterized protein LOC108630576 [Ceratina calcarata]